MGFDFQSYLQKMKKDKKRHVQVIALYWDFKGFNFENEEQLLPALKRELRGAMKLRGYSDEKIMDTMEYLDSETNIDWKIETIHKYIDEDLEKLRSKYASGYQLYR